MKTSREAQDFVRTMKKRKDILAVYLFGSVASGKANQNSDVDICVIPAKESKSLDLVVGLGANAPAKFDVVSFYRLPIQIRHRVFREGKSLYEKDRQAVSRIIFSTIREYLDMKPGLDRIYAGILKPKVARHG